MSTYIEELIKKKHKVSGISEDKFVQEINRLIEITNQELLILQADLKRYKEYKSRKRKMVFFQHPVTLRPGFILSSSGDY